MIIGSKQEGIQDLGYGIAFVGAEEAEPLADLGRADLLPGVQVGLLHCIAFHCNLTKQKCCAMAADSPSGTGCALCSSCLSSPKTTVCH